MIKNAICPSFGLADWKSPPYGQIECRTSASGSNKMETLLIKKGKFSIWGIFGLPQISPKIKNVLILLELQGQT
jgi:hypothetical protein